MEKHEATARRPQGSLLSRTASALAAALLFTCGSVVAGEQPAQSPSGAPGLPQFPPFKRIATPPEPDAIALYEGVAPGSEGAMQAEIWDEIMGERVARDVTRPTLTPFIPDPAKATGAAVIVAPGGAYMMLAMDIEGYAVARALAERGIAAFVLKYRLDPTPADETEFKAVADSRFMAAAKAGADKVAPIKQPLAIKDAVAALALVRSRAATWHVDPKRVGMVGFSAGAMTVLEATLQNEAPRPDFTGVIYGPMTAVSAPAPLPPLFLAIAADDPLFGNSGFGIAESWKQAGAPVELHLYEKGGHGFGMRHQGTTSDLWLEEFVQWLQSRGMLLAQQAPPGPPPGLPPFDPAALERELTAFNKLPDTPGTGRFPALKEEVPSLPDHVIYRPANLAGLGKTRLGVLAWGNGACANDGAGSRMHLAEIASHGYLVIANGKILSGPGFPPEPRPFLSPDGKLPPPQTEAADLSKAIDWALRENARAGSPYFGRIDPHQIAVSGWSCGGLQALRVASDPRIKAVIIHNSGIFNEGMNRMPGMDVSKDTLKTLHTPILYVLGGPTDIAYANGMDDFQRITQVPAMVANLDVGHGGTFLKANGGAAATAAVNWLNWQLRGDATAARFFVGAKCGLCQDHDWQVQRHNFELFEVPTP